jgi:hypothetical protein
MPQFFSDLSEIAARIGLFGIDLIAACFLIPQIW